MTTEEETGTLSATSGLFPHGGGSPCRFCGWRLPSLVLVSPMGRLTDQDTKTRCGFSRERFRPDLPIISNRGIDDFTAKQAPPTKDRFAAAAPLGIFQRNGHHQAMTAWAGHNSASLHKGGGSYAWPLMESSLPRVGSEEASLWLIGRNLGPLYWPGTAPLDPDNAINHWVAPINSTCWDQGH